MEESSGTPVPQKGIQMPVEGFCKGQGSLHLTLLILGREQMLAWLGLGMLVWGGG